MFIQLSFPAAESKLIQIFSRPQAGKVSSNLNTNALLIQCLGGPFLPGGKVL